MKNRTIVLICCIIVVLILVSVNIYVFCNETYNQKQVPVNGSIVIKDKTIDAYGVIVSPEYTMLPLTRVLEEFNIDINWIDSDKAEIQHGDNLFTLDIEKKSLVLRKLGHELLAPFPGGSSFCCVVVGNEILLDHDTLTAILACYFDIKTDLTINYEQGIVSIDEIYE